MSAAAVLSGCVLGGTSGSTSGSTGTMPAPLDERAFDLVAPGAPRLADVWTARPDGVIAVTGKPAGFLATRASYENFRLHVEWRWPDKPGNGGVLLYIASGPKDGVWPLSLQVQTKHGSVGDLLPMAGASFAEPLTSAPGAYPAIKAHVAADSERPAGAWNSMDVTSRAGVVDVAINGVPQNRVTAAAPRAGRIGFQLEGTPYELRNLRLEPLP